MRRKIHQRRTAESPVGPPARSIAGSAVRSLVVFALWAVLACTSRIGTPEITENFRRYFLDVWAAAR